MSKVTELNLTPLSDIERKCLDIIKTSWKSLWLFEVMQKRIMEQIRPKQDDSDEIIASKFTLLEFMLSKTDKYRNTLAGNCNAASAIIALLNKQEVLTPLFPAGVPYLANGDHINLISNHPVGIDSMEGIIDQQIIDTVREISENLSDADKEELEKVTYEMALSALVYSHEEIEEAVVSVRDYNRQQYEKNLASVKKFRAEMFEEEKKEEE